MTRQLTRRGFIKSAFGLSALIVFSPTGLIKAFVPKEIPKIGSLLEVFIGELKRQPTGHIAHSLFGLETIVDEISFGTLIRGLTISKDHKSLRYWAFAVDEQSFLSDVKVRQTSIDSLYKNLENDWLRHHQKWGKAPDPITRPEIRRDFSWKVK